MKDWFDFAERVGVPSAVLVIILIFGFYFIVKPLVKSFNNLIDSLKETNKTNTESLKKLTELVESDSKRIARLEEIVRVKHGQSTHIHKTTDLST